jgi:cell wall-associated NlpC family hydrolase
MSPVRLPTAPALGRYLQLAYVDKGRDPAVGVDCWGLAQLFFREQFGVALPSYDGRYSASKARAEIAALVDEQLRIAWCRTDTPAFGDLVMMELHGRPFHVGIAVNALEFIHALNPGIGVVKQEFSAIAWAKRIEGIYRYVSV